MLRFQTSIAAGLFLAFLSSVQAQIPNPGFEDWIIYPCSLTLGPSGWVDDHYDCTNQTIKRSTNCHSDSFAVYGSYAMEQHFWFPPSLQTGFPVSSRTKYFTGYFEFQPGNGGVLSVEIRFYRMSQLISFDSIFFSEEESAYKLFSIPISWHTTDTPDSCNIWIFATAPLAPTYNDPGTNFYLDDLAFSDVESVQQTGGESAQRSFRLSQCYPNPFNPSTIIQYELPTGSFVTLTLFDVLGREVKTLVREWQTAGIHTALFDGANLPSGVYFYSLRSGTLYDTKKLILLK